MPLPVARVARAGRPQLHTTGLGRLQGSFRPGANPFGLILGNGGQNMDSQFVGVGVIFTPAGQIPPESHLHQVAVETLQALADWGARSSNESPSWRPFASSASFIWVFPLFLGEEFVTERELDAMLLIEPCKHVTL